MYILHYLIYHQVYIVRVRHIFGNSKLCLFSNFILLLIITNFLFGTDKKKSKTLKKSYLSSKICTIQTAIF